MTVELASLLADAQRDNTSSTQRLFEALYGELHVLAESQLRGGHGLSISPTTLLHDAYLNMAGRDGLRFPDRARFLGYAARAMRTLVIDYVRQSKAQKRGGGDFELTLTTDAGVPAQSGVDAASLAELSDAMDELATLDPALSELVDLHFFCGYSLIDIAQMRDVSERTVQRDWRKARALLHRALREGDTNSTPA